MAEGNVRRLRFTSSRPRSNDQVTVALLPKLLAARGMVGHELRHDIPEAARMVHFDEVGDFMRYDVVDESQRHLHEPPVEMDPAARMTTAPTGARVRKHHRRRRFDAEQSRVMRHAL